MREELRVLAAEANLLACLDPLIQGRAAYRLRIAAERETSGRLCG
jgi:hypothetical protein